MRLEIQGLRCVAVVYVLLYHLWDNHFPVGYLGVDVFFVISGYLMCTIVGKSSPLDLQKTISFFFRRFKRLVPTYLFIIISVVIAGLYLLAPVEYQTLATDGLYSATFVSNYLGLGQRGYFDLYGEYRLLKHSWSLSCEVQFYLCVPLFFLVFERLDRKDGRWKIGLLGVISLISFLIQTLADRSTGHTTLQARLWQFLAGFLGSFAHDSRLFDFDRLGQKPCIEEGAEDKNSQQSFQFSSRLHFLINSFLLTSLLVVLTFDFTGIDPINRLLITVITFAIVVKPTGSLLLQLEPLVKLGDISYSVYLIHWPVFTFHRYWFAEFYSHRGQHASFVVGAQLVFTSIVLGYVVEIGYKNVALRLTNWLRLISTIFTCYLVIAGGIICLFICSPIYSYESAMSLDAQLSTEAKILRLYESRDTNSIVSKSDLADLNMEIYVYSRQFYACSNQTARIPTRYPADLSFMTSFCHLKGSGSKNVVIIGNSHGRELLHGFRHHFTDAYDHLTLFVRDYCMPFLSNFAEEHMSTTCHKHVNQLIPILTNWKTPIDLIVVGMEYFDFLDPPLLSNHSNDEYFTEMQRFYDQLNEIARETVFVPNVHIDWFTEPFASILQKELHFTRDLSYFQQTQQQQQSYLKNVQKRVDLVDCSKCVKVNWSRAWCSNGDCKAIDRRNLAYFRDAKHINSYGSLVYGKLLRNAYDKQKSSFS
ncbi:O-acetyltransferase OatA [Aphelenchoides besseyi]|nr:O-acetyltransferase OatA [Aphelenchoides besseyi]